MRCPCGAEYGHFSRNVVEAVANNETIDGLEVMQERMGMGRVQGTQRADEDKLETGDEDGEWEGDEFDASLFFKRLKNESVRESPSIRPSNLDQAPETTLKRRWGRPPGSKNKSKSTSEIPRNHVTPLQRQSASKQFGTPSEATSDGSRPLCANGHASLEMPLPVHKRRSRNPAPVYNDPSSLADAVAATSSVSFGEGSIQKPQLATCSGMGIGGLATSPEEQVGSNLGLPSTELSAKELRQTYGKPRWWYNDGNGKFLAKVQDYPPGRSWVQRLGARNKKAPASRLVILKTGGRQGGTERKAVSA
ncbi:MAG: hypothetical protein L6R40_000149 [Gallowayella cf. fulva]|nr:MAG: hypothetical protein L6R40_000149 [Xanthomendoza cf. fulva]